MLPDGSSATRIPGYRLWLWDGEFCGSIGFRWQPGTSSLPSHVLGHIGYAVVPWKTGLGYAKLALRLMLQHVREEGLEYVEITIDPENFASRRVVEANGGFLAPQSHIYVWLFVWREPSIGEWPRLDSSGTLQRTARIS